MYSNTLISEINQHIALKLHFRSLLRVCNSLVLQYERNSI